MYITPAYTECHNSWARALVTLRCWCSSVESIVNKQLHTIKLTELPVNPILLALSIAVRTLLMAPAAANLALSVIDRACTPSCAVSYCISNTMHSTCTIQVIQLAAGRLHATAMPKS
jgi:hypothetical protein